LARDRTRDLYGSEVNHKTTAENRFQSKHGNMGIVVFSKKAAFILAVLRLFEPDGVAFDTLWIMTSFIKVS
jgi:hypothetical protein